MTAHRVTCQCCSGVVQGELYHLGYSDMDCMYCDSCPRVLLLHDHTLAERNGINRPHLRAGDPGWELYDRHLLPYYAKFEDLFRSCVCGGRFRMGATPRCPLCNGSIMGISPEVDKPSTWRKGHVFVMIDSFNDTEWLNDAQPVTPADDLRPPLG